eukprot:g65248.t1
MVKCISVRLRKEGAEAPLKTPSEPVRYLYYKQHKQRKSENSDDDLSVATTDGRVLFVSNIPFNWQAQDVSELFSIFGPVEATFLEKGHGHTAHVMFESKDSTTAALSQDLHDAQQPFIEGRTPTGMEKWVQQYKAERPDAKLLKTQVDRFMEGFDTQMEAEKKAREGGPIVDEDGFQLVTRKRPAGKRLLPSDVSSESSKQRKKKKKSTLHFYRFQEREEKRGKLDELRKKFEEDKARIEKLKASRKFKPFN